MIKRLRFVSRDTPADPDRFVTAWRIAAAGVAQAPAYTRPLRVTLCLPVPDLAAADADGPRHDAVVMEWFRDAWHLRRFVAWLDTRDGRIATEPAEGVVAADSEQAIVADERVLRGAEWLRRHRRSGGPVFTHMALGLRDERLSQEEFSRRWARHAGRIQVGGGAASVIIPESVRGDAYIQNHPFSRPNGWAYDAVNEVCFDDLDGLRGRDAWFRRNTSVVGRGLVRAAWFLAVREVTLFAAERPPSASVPTHDNAAGGSVAVP